MPLDRNLGNSLSGLFLGQVLSPLWRRVKVIGTCRVITAATLATLGVQQASFKIISLYRADLAS